MKKTYLAVKAVVVFALGWNSADFLRTMKKLLCFFQERRKTWGKIAWKQIADEEYRIIDPKKGEAKTEKCR